MAEFISNRGSMWPGGKVLTQDQKGLGFDSHCWSCVEEFNKLLCLPSSGRCLADENMTALLKVLAYLYDLCAVFSQGR